MSSILADFQHLTIHGEVEMEEITPGYPMIQISNAHATATIALYGAHLTHYAHRAETPIIFTSKAAIYREGKAIRGGIPVCWPWFGAYPLSGSDPKENLPAHGYARISFWKLISTSSDSDGTRLTFSLPPTEGATLSATIEFIIGKELKIRLTSTNTGTETETISEALHSYFAVGDAKQTEVIGLDGCSYLDTTIQPPARKQQSGPIGFPDEIDRIYSSSDNLVVDDQTNQRRILVSKSGSHSSIIWNPGQEKGPLMSDLKDQEVTQFICAEAGNVNQESITLKPGSTHTLTLTISSTQS